ncbi:MAG: hypothetical protein ACQER5_12315, partial [Pseudomonadota bacterium]
TVTAANGGVLLAIVIMALATYLTRAGGVFVMALVATAGVMLVLRKPLPAIAAGILTAALWRLIAA